MVNVYVGWAGAAAVLAFVALLLGIRLGNGPFGVLIDSRGRYSLTHLQLVLWTVVVVSLVAGVFWGRLLGGPAASALGFKIPDNLLLVLGISLGSAAASTAAKSYKDSLPGDRVSRSVPGSKEQDLKPFFAQVFLLEEGAMADKAVDVTKFQSFWITVILVASYVALAIGRFASGDVTQAAPPDFTQQMVILLGISHAGYIAGKLPERTGTPDSTGVLMQRSAEPAPVQPPAPPPAATRS
jgi:hypothetical protein